MRTAFIATLLFVAGCESKPSGPSYDQALQTYTLEIQELERLTKKKDDLRKEFDSMDRDAKSAQDSYGIGTPKYQEFAALRNEIQQKSQPVMEAMNQQISTQEEKVRRQKAILDEAEKRR